MPRCHSSGFNGVTRIMIRNAFDFRSRQIGPKDWNSGFGFSCLAHHPPTLNMAVCAATYGFD